ncbi:MAG: hypothetical protein AAGG72_04115 [Pseudomonadota bacterium]
MTRAEWFSKLLASDAPSNAKLVGTVLQWASTTSLDPVKITTKAISEQTSLAERTVKRARAWLSENGWIISGYGSISFCKTGHCGPMKRANVAQSANMAPPETGQCGTIEGANMAPFLYIQEKPKVSTTSQPSVKTKYPLGSPKDKIVRKSSIQTTAEMTALLRGGQSKHDPSIRRRDDGSLELLNGTRQFWLEKFSGDEDALNAALLPIQFETEALSGPNLFRTVQRNLGYAAGRHRARTNRFEKSKTGYCPDELEQRMQRVAEEMQQ